MSSRVTELRVLVVDDQADSVELMCMFLEQLGHTCTHAECGLDALERAASFEPHVVLLDVGLPDLSGYDVVRALRERPGGGELFVAALTGWGKVEDRERALAAGFDRHLTKPATSAMIREVMIEAAMRRGGR